MNTAHADRRAQQRCISPLIEQWLNQFGEEIYDGQGGVLRYFSHASKRAMEREFGSAPVRKMSEFLNVYAVESSQNGCVITIGHRRKRIFRR